jgi:hypothetical protein
MTDQLPRIAQRAERLVLRVLFIAAHSDIAAQGDEVRSAASAIRLAPDDPQLGAVSPPDAAALSEAARIAFRRYRNAPEALDLQMGAFGANPLDTEIVGNLALLNLKQRPGRAHAARQLALHALTIHDARYPAGRIEDWTTLAIASALLGLDYDARNAWFVTLALAPDAGRQCRAALDAYAAYGERLRAPVEAMLYRLEVSGRRERSPLCVWPPYWMRSTDVR